MENASAHLNWAIIGTGSIAREFAADLSTAFNAAPVAVCSRSEAKAKEFSDEFGISKAYSSLPSLLDDGEIDAVYIATPNLTHFEFAKAAIIAKKAVLVEKPIAINPAEAEELSVIAQENNVFLMEALWSRFLPAWQFVHQYINEEKLGRIEKVVADLAFKNPRTNAPPDGGVLRDLGVYPISLALYLFGTPQSTDGEWPDKPNGVDLSARWRMNYQQFSCQFSCAANRNGSNMFLIEGTKGSLVVASPFIGSKGVFYFHRKLRMLAEVVSAAGLFPKLVRALLKRLSLPGVKYYPFEFSGYGLQFEIAAFTRTIADGQTENPISPLAHSCETLRIIEQILANRPG